MPTIHYDTDGLRHFEAFLVERRESKPEPWVGALPSAWAHSANGGGLERWTERMCRSCLRSALEAESSPLIRAMLVLSWGRMRTRNAALLLKGRSSEWLSLVDWMWNGDLSPTDAYARFRTLRDSPVGAPKGLPGMGPAYYTKLIYFLARGAKPGYIMDQWTACSVNLLCGADVVLTDVHKSWSRGGRLTEAYTVSDQNSAENYRAFNDVLEDLALRYKLEGEEIELALFDQGRGKGRWRNHVVEHRQAPYDARLRKVVEDDEDGAMPKHQGREREKCRCCSPAGASDHTG